MVNPAARKTLWSNLSGGIAFVELPEVHVDVISRSLEFLKLTLILLPLDTQTDLTWE